MKVDIGPFIYRWTTRSFEDLWFKLRHRDSYVDDSKYDKWDRRVVKFADWWQSILNSTINKLFIDRKKRKIEVKIESHDIWASDFHLAQIILPMMKLLKEKKHGAPFVDDEDVPDNIKSTNAPKPENEWDINDLHFTRYEWLIDEIIWTFEQLADEDNEYQFYDHTEADKLAKDNILESWKHIKIDHDGLKTHNARINNGTKLFGKYLRSLSD